MICRCITVEKLFWQHSHSISGNACFSNLQGTILQKSNFPQTCCFLLLSSISTVLTSPEKIATDFQQLLYTVCRASATSWTLVVGWHLLFKQRAGQGNLNSRGNRAPKKKKKKEKRTNEHMWYQYPVVWIFLVRVTLEYEWGDFTLCIILSNSVLHFLVFIVFVILIKKWKYNSARPWETHLLLCQYVI